jgi:hypothetical protein
MSKNELSCFGVDIKHQIEKSESRLEHKIDKLDLRLSNLEVRVSGVEKRIETLSANMKWIAGVALTYLTVLITFVQFVK